MAIYLDANVLFPWRTFAELDRVALTIVAHQINQPVIIPQIAAIEAELNFRRSLEAAVGRIESAHREINRLFERDEILHLEGVDVDDKVRSWRDRLKVVGYIEQADPNDALDALKREAAGNPPARRLLDGSGRDKGGRGARDAAIWLASVRHHGLQEKEGHFVTKDANDFLHDGQLRPELADDLGAGAYRLYVYNGIGEFLKHLGTSTDGTDVQIQELVSDRVRTTLELVLSNSDAAPRAVFSELPDWNFRTELIDAEPVRIMHARRYEDRDDVITVVDSEWRLRVNIYGQPFSATERTAWYVFDDAELTGTIQLYLPGGRQRELRPQIVGTRLKSNITAFITKEGTVTTVEPAAEHA